MATREIWQLGCVVALRLLCLFQYVWLVDSTHIQAGYYPQGRVATGTIAPSPRSNHNPHSGFPRHCAEPGPLPSGYDGTPPSQGHNQHETYTPYALYRMQVCQYEALDLFVGIAERLNVTRWVANAGSLIGAQCYSSMEPWDDDIDILVSNQHLAKFQALWLTAAPGIPRFHRDRWEQRFLQLQNQTVLFYKMVGHAMFKLVPLALKAANMGRGDDLGGLDLWFEKDVFNAAVLTYIDDGDNPLRDHAFGPTRIQSVPGKIAAAYIRNHGWTHIQHPDPAVVTMRADCVRNMVLPALLDKMAKVIDQNLATSGKAGSHRH